MEVKELTKTIMMISNCKNPSVSMAYAQIFQAFSAPRVNDGIPDKTTQVLHKCGFVAQGSDKKEIVNKTFAWIFWMRNV